MCTDARLGGLSGRRGGWEEEEVLVFGGRGFLGRRDGRAGLGMSPSFTSSPIHTYKIIKTHMDVQRENNLQDILNINSQNGDSNTHTQACVIR